MVSSSTANTHAGLQAKRSKGIYEESDDEGEDNVVDLTPQAKSPWAPFQQLFKGGGFCHRPRLEYTESQRDLGLSEQNLKDPPRIKREQDLDYDLTESKKKSKKKSSSSSAKKEKSKSDRKKKHKKDDKKSSKNSPKKSRKDRSGTPPLTPTEDDENAESTWETRPRDFSCENNGAKTRYLPDIKEKLKSKTNVRISEERFKKIVETMWLVLLVLMLVMWTFHRAGIGFVLFSSSSSVDAQTNDKSAEIVEEGYCEDPDAEPVAAAVEMGKEGGNRVFSFLKRLIEPAVQINNGMIE